MNKVQEIGYYAKDFDGNLHQYQWQDDTFEIYDTTSKKYVPSNFEDYEILNIGYFHDEITKNQTYEMFLFSQLFMKHVENNDTQYQDLAYDLIFPEVLKHREIFLNSSFNVSVRSEYDCIEDYLSNKIK